MGINEYSMNFYLYLYCMVLGTSSFTLNDFDLPGIFSSDICSNSSLSKKLSPLCQCRDQTEISDISSLCKSHVEFGDCVAANLKEIKRNDIFLKHVFSHKKFDHNIAHLCRIQSDAAEIAQCTTPSVPKNCNSAFEHFLIGTESFNESRSCSIVHDTLRECYWGIYKSSCPPTVRYFWSKLSESFLSMKCSKYGQSKTDRCMKIRNAFYPNSKKRKYQTKDECHESVKTMRQCFQMERLDSLHHDDIWHNMEFELDKFMIYERFRCDFQKEKDKSHHCEHPHRKKLEHCINNIYGRGFEKQTQLLHKGGNVTINEICRLYEDTTHCIENVLKDCVLNGAHLNAIFCGSMPASCHCPVNVANYISARTSASSKLAPATWIMLLVTCTVTRYLKVFRLK
ncbi:uncharacterized protein LOC132730311 [Ruditapes philippinarum]|uniref:uncharacterized protein LOC132730311 n=1 Tax=Ruditapes philippinarum TaxID=129788 RepID=UPI00295B7B58|nr:uncharacterized protein LOC132730311 [Ruditapes philippinarum]